MITENETQTFANATEEVEQLEGDARKEWLETGELPSEKPAPAAPAEPPKETPLAEPEASRFEKPKEAPKRAKPNQMSHRQLRDRVVELERQNAELAARGTAPAAAEPPKPAATAPPVEERAKPTPTDKDDKGQPKYKTYEEYLEDLSDWKVEQRIARLEKETLEKQAKADVERDQRAISETWVQQVETARAKHADFDTVALNPQLPIPQGSAVEQWVLDSDIGTEILYHLASHPDELKAINAMTPVKAARALTVLEAELSDAPQEAPPTETPAAPENGAPKRVTSAPPPAREVGNRQRAADYDPAAEALKAGDFAEYRRLQNAKELKARG